VRKRGGVIYLADDIFKRLGRVEYYLIIGGANLGCVLDRSDSYYLDKTTGKWVSDPFVFRHVYGIGGDSDAEEISREQAQQWVAANCSGISPEGL